MSLAVLLVPPSTLEIAGYLGLVAFFALVGLVIDTPSRRLFEGSHGQYALALGINAALFLAPLFLWVMPVVRSSRAEPFALLVVLTLALAVSYLLLRLARMLPGIGFTMRALDRARRRQKLGGAA